ncbi:MAG: TIGR03915 family putative DNA repair protein [Lachnospiraceae bacterium]|nr:TIGR03915 family putative DNA repair protein [Lachnospiraceae bacterium]
METVVFLCEDEIDGMFTGIYDAWASGFGHDHVRVEVNHGQTFSLFCRYVQVKTDPLKAEKVARSVRKKISERAYHLICRAALSTEPDKADVMYRFLLEGFRYGARITTMLAHPAVMRIFEIDRYVGNEAHFFREFIRFKHLNSGIYFGKIEPVNRIASLLAPSFEDRMPSENWAIYDATWGDVVVHRADGPWVLVRPDGDEWEHWLKEAEDEDAYQHLWQTFFHTIGIAERKNPQCQRSHMPLRYRKNAVEFWR